MHELLAVVAHEVSSLGPSSPISEVTLSEGPLPTGDDDVYVVVPHEYFVVMPPEELPSPGQLERTIGFCVEHPGNETFETTVRMARQLAACVDINDDSTVELNALGIAAERFVLGYSTSWDRWHGGESDRPHDVIYLGTTDDRRSRLLAFDVEPLHDADVLMAMPPHEPMVRPRPDFFMGEEKLELLGASKVMLNLHRGTSRSLEWARVLEAMCNGCVVVSEHSVDFAPLRPGEHLLFGSPRTLVHLARSLLADPARLASIRAELYGFLRTELDMRSSALALAQLAADVRAGSPPRRPSPGRPVAQAAWPSDRAGRVFCEDAPERSGLVRSVQPPPPTPASKICAGESLGTRAPDAVDVLIVRLPGSPDVSVALGPVLRQIGSDSMVHVCLDGVDSGALPDDRRLVLHGGPNQGGWGALANEALGASDASLLLVLFAGDQLVPRALDRLRHELRAHGTDAAYGMVVTPEGLLTSALPFEPRRLATSDYLAAPALWRRTSLVGMGGWSDDPSVHGLEVWDLWHRLGASGGSAHLVPRPLVYQAFAQSDPSTT
jgi:hypothetical protein